MCAFKDIFETLQDIHEDFSSTETSSENAAVQKALTAIANKSGSQDSDEGVKEFRTNLLRGEQLSEESLSLSEISAAIECTARTISKGQKFKRCVCC